MQTPPKLLKPVEVGVRLGTSERTVYRMIEQGILPSVLVDRGLSGEHQAVRITEADLAAYEAGRSQAAS